MNFCHTRNHLIFFRHILIFIFCIESQCLFTFTHLLKCVFRLRLSSIFGCNFPICSSSLDNVFVLFFFSIFCACSRRSFDCRRLLKNIETLLRSTVPPVRVACSIVSFLLSNFQVFPFSFCFSASL